MSITEEERIDALGTACRIHSDGWDDVNLPRDLVVRALIIVCEMTSDQLMVAANAARRTARQRLGEHAERQLRLRPAAE